MPSKSLRNAVMLAFPGLFCILRMCAPRRAAAVVRPRGHEKSADRRRRILISRLLIIRALVPRRKSLFPAYFKGFPAVSPLIPSYPAFLKYPVSPHCDLFVNSQKDGCLWAVFVAYLLRGFFQKRRFGLKNYNSITSFSPMLRNRRSRCLPSVGHLFQDHSRTIMTFCLQNCLQCYEMAFFIGYQVEGCFSSVKVQKSSICSLTSE